ncbi:unnamed protein product [Phytophthora lilii]|uniref:Unnamed protein product n=1 Tax=Phytophthora lilii TaxID=2077276 RepID=A0A9W6TLA2_9STRA|nr:unnamed protein product [Phytophthora lilii]
MAKHWKIQCQAKSVHSITGYVGIAIEVLCRAIPVSKSWGDEVRTPAQPTDVKERFSNRNLFIIWVQTAEIFNFIREMLLAKDGAEVVLSCGGKDLLEVLHSCFPDHVDDCSSETECLCDSDRARNTSPAPRSPHLGGTFGGEKVAAVVINLLKKAVLGFTDLSSADANLFCESTTSVNPELLPAASISSRPGDAEYDDYVSKLFHLEKSCHFKSIALAVEEKNVSNSEMENAKAPICPSNAEEPQETNEVNSEEVKEHNDVEESENDDTSVPVDSSGEDETEVDVDADLENVQEENDDDSDDSDDNDGDIKKVEPGDDTIEIGRVPSLCSFPLGVSPSSLECRNLISRKISSSRDTSTSHFFDHLEDRKWYFVDSSQVKYPKHPSRMNQEGQNNPEDDFVLDEPGFLEPCNLPESEVGVKFVEEAAARRAEFIASDVNSRARIVYENMSMVEDREKKVAGIAPFLLNACTTQHDAPYFVPEKTKAFPELATSLTFDSNFESGNLERAIRIGESEYDLILRHDFNSSGHMQWFYFAVSNIQAPSTSPRGGQKYRFNIVNLCKPNSLFNQGLQPVVYSVRDAHQKGKGWIRSGTDIYYFANSFVRPPRNAASFAGVAPTDVGPTTINSSANPMTYYTLTFTLEFWNADDTYLIAHSYPYTLTMHQLHIDSILCSGRETRQILRHSSLCTTLSGRNCDLLTISDFSVAPQELSARKAVFITSRVHPGESQASWMMRGVIDFLIGGSAVARALRRMFVFQIIPMLNPDGVYYGNSRCGLSACDLNRQWQTPSKALHPTIFHAKELLLKERSLRGVAFYCDMHGHSRKKNVFMYGCDTKRKPNPAARAFAKLFSMQQIGKKYISLPDCSFKVSKDKETTARVVVANELKINWSFTLEASFCGANYGELQNMHFNTKHLREAGASLCEALFQACIGDSNVREKLMAVVDDATVSVPQNTEAFLREAGVSSESYPVDEEANSNPRASFLKGKAGSGKKATNELTPKSVRRKNSKLRAVGASDAGAVKATEVNEGSGRRKKLSRQQNKSLSLGSNLLDGVTRDASIQAFVTDDPASGLDLAYIPPPKLSGRKLRSKYPKVRRTKSSPDGHVKSRRRAIPSLASTDIANESSETFRYIATADSRGAVSDCQLNDSVMPLVSPSKLSAVPGPPSSSVRVSLGSFQGPESTYVRSPKSISFPYPSNVLGIPLRDSSVLLPSPVGEAMTRSPKAPANRIRFR